MNTLYWHDYETWGATPARDRPCQFAGVRTDQALNVVGEPLQLYCRPPVDMLPHPEACLVTGITPQQALAEGVTEREFMAAIHRELVQPGTCGVGYNSLRFDDEVTRYGLYRNFYDPYEREWKNGNSRWDIIDMLRLTRALRPAGIEWPDTAEGKPSFKLEAITQANGLAHEAAHDALSDVHATIAVARLVKERQPALYQYVFELRKKQRVAELIDLRGRRPLLHISSMFPAERGCAALVVPLAKHPTNTNAVVVFDLCADPGPLLALDSEGIRARVFTPKDALAPGVERLPLKLVHLNKCPVLATPKLLDRAAAARLNIDRDLCEKHWQQLLRADIAEKIQQVFAAPPFEQPADPEQQLYAGFLNDRDRQTVREVREADGAALADTSFSFHDPRLPELLFRYRARNFPETLSQAERQLWHEHSLQRLSGAGEEGFLTLAAFGARVAELRAEGGLTPQQDRLLADLLAYGEDLVARLRA
ncbi:exodeoxyribonuclease I [Exilibacterium tricleocarpae]|uniref:Exodeoxyribonuclease I n=1 Tax=Exilibacterium tricleocarpae TaxID=2591008 RepID=A0A545TQU2_9GAMM|nr:exodeoxyribonuclease I [Exilibacterium tricleocarpae]TQV79491.1 exodeoxyribonuclease I [Exilibacterium tricleocarpae]